jgi:hypothetical protein
MRSAWADEFDRHLRSPACIRGAHENCPHLSGFGYRPNLRRLRLEVGQTLCKCECHSSCPVTSNRTTVPAQIWRESCTCPGAEDKRSRLDQIPDLSKDVARTPHSSPACREAFVAARARGAGRSRVRVKDLYKAELRARGLDIPPEIILDADVSRITADYLAAARLFGRWLAGLAKRLGGICRPVR